MQPSWQCVRLVRGDDGNTIQYAIVKDLFQKKTWHIHASMFVIAAGAVLTPQILFKSEIQPRALGHFLCMQPLAFCQVVLLQSIVDAIPKDKRWEKEVEKYQREHPQDPIPIPIKDPQPQVLPYIKYM